MGSMGCTRLEGVRVEDLESFLGNWVARGVLD